jgi:hypothetical protein
MWRTIPSTGDEELTISLAHDLGADRYNDASYVWYPNLAPWLPVAMVALVCIAGIAGLIMVAQDEMAKKLAITTTASDSDVQHTAGAG